MTSGSKNFLEKRPDLTRERLHRTREMMNAAISDCLVKDYEGLIATLHLPDPDDRHVLAAAVIAGASLIVTFNLKDFPSRLLKRYNIEAIHPDHFVLQLIQSNRAAVVQAVDTVRRRLRHPPTAREQYLARLAEVGLPKAAAALG